MPDAPLIGEFPPDGENGQELVDQLVAFGASGRAVAGPPGIEEERLTALQEGFTCAMENEELLAELDEQERPVGYLSGEETAELVDQILQPSEEFRTVVEESF
jgi:tripartite-type tricarboxylate transporter receptor subunit TctC